MNRQAMAHVARLLERKRLLKRATPRTPENLWRVTMASGEVEVVEADDIRDVADAFEVAKSVQLVGGLV